MIKKTSLLAAAITAAMLGACSQQEQNSAPAATETASTEAAAHQSETEKANLLFDELFMERIMMSPEFQTFLGIKDNQDKWDDLSEAQQKKQVELRRQQLEKVKAEVEFDKLDANGKISYSLFVQQAEQFIDNYRWRHHNYPINQMFGTHTRVPNLLIAQHRIDSVKDAQDYIARLRAVPTLFDQQITGLDARAEKGIIAPSFVFPYVIGDSRNIISGFPFSEGQDSPLMADVRGKIEKLGADEAVKTELLTAAETALREQVGPAYEKLISALESLQKRSDTRDGAWKFPDGEDFYNNALALTTTTDLSAEAIHKIGLEEVERIHAEMRAIMAKVEFKGDMQAFFAFMRDDPRFYKSNDAAGKQAYLDEATALIDNMKSRLDELFNVKPKADLVVKQVEAFREKSAGKAFYQRPAPDGSRPGMYYANLYDMKSMPTYQMEALAYHEGIPGHHMQLAISQELQGIPKFRKYGGYTAYTEGWGLYSELVPKEMGLYADPYSDFGRLAMELWRACRLVVDTGIHAKRWTREEAIDYLKVNTPNPDGDIVKAIERYIVMPSQATAYKIGMLKIQELRATAEQELGEGFDIREFHDIVLKNGPIPLNVLEQLINDWVASQKA